ncbi:ParB/RepB/Spo0J family partition protein [Lysobacter antibioticus]|uniref:ParB/RepB/Spo0J family partition protein n=1 Tax=Lysobacter antibioticus TaxID=84531 RepID=UPI0007E8C73F|nr:ParB/RepB/Spo0J family partition protein [Lysobacter antibioticus]
MSLSFHPLCLSLPDMTPDAFKALVDDVRRNGQLRDIVLYEGMILDGRHRYRACLDSGIDPRMVEFSGNDPVAFVISENVARRHLSESQRAMVAAQLAVWGKGKPRKSENFPINAPKQPQVAEMLSVSDRTIRKASEVRKHGAAQLVARVEAGEMTVSEAAKIAQLGKQSQERILGIEDRQERKKEVAKALSISQGRKNSGPRTDFIESVEQAPWLVTFMARLEGLIQCATNAGIDPASLRDRLVNETNWNDSRFAERYGRAMPWLEAIGRLPKAPDRARRTV